MWEKARLLTSINRTPCPPSLKRHRMSFAALQVIRLTIILSNSSRGLLLKTKPRGTEKIRRTLLSNGHPSLTISLSWYTRQCNNHILLSTKECMACISISYTCRITGQLLWRAAHQSITKEEATTSLLAITSPMPATQKTNSNTRLCSRIAAIIITHTIEITRW